MKLFISYSRDDKAWVYELWRALRDEAGHDAWIDRRLVPAQDWWQTILENIEACECFVYVLTPMSVASIYCRAELEYALALNKPVLPLMLKPCDYPPRLGQKRVQYQVISDDMNMDRVLLRVEMGLSGVQRGIDQRKYLAPTPPPPRPDLPKPDKPEHVSEVYLLAEEAAVENNIPLAEKLFKQVMDADPQGWGLAAAERLGEIRRERDRRRDYLAIVELAASPALARGAGAAVKAYVQKYGMDYDPNRVLAGLLASKPPPAPAGPIPAQSASEGRSDLGEATKGGAAAESKPGVGQAKQFRQWIIVAAVLLLVGGGLWLIGQFVGQPVSGPSTANTAVTTNAQWTPQFQSFDGVEMALVPPGCFTMGSDSLSADEKPSSKTCSDKPFWIDKTEVTQAQFKRFQGSAARPPAFAGDNRPVESITWFKARDFCAKRGARLPTEAEWEYAARGPDNLVYPWGNVFDSSKAVYGGNSGSQTAEVGSRPTGASWVGALDMSGNVWEWVSSLYRPYPYNPADGRESLDDAANPRVVRGGSWLNSNYVGNLQAAYRLRLDPSIESDGDGFRCARSS